MTRCDVLIVGAGTRPPPQVPGRKGVGFKGLSPPAGGSMLRFHPSMA